MTINAAALAAAQETERQLSAIDQPSPELDKAKASAAMTTAQIATIKEPIKNVQYYGAKGDGVTDDTAAFNRAAATGSIIVDVPGTYLLDPVVRVTIGVDGTVMRVHQSPGAVKFKAKTNNAAKYRIFNVTATKCDLDLGGAHLIGDRLSHKWAVQSNSAYNTHEWGYCFFLGGASNRLYGNGLGLITGATGDGLGISGPDHEVFGLVLDGNRRQGCSAFNAPRLDFHDNVCRNTGPLPTDLAPKVLTGPFCGLDIEPDGGDCLDVHIHGNTFGPANRSGAIFWVNSRAGVVKLSGKVFDNLITGNSNGAWLNDEVAGRYNINFEFLRNRLVNNKAHDIRCDQGSIVKIGDGSAANANIFDDFTERTDKLRSGIVSPEIGVYRGAKVSAPLNSYV